MTVDVTFSPDNTFSQQLIIAISDEVANEFGDEAVAGFTDVVGEFESDPDVADLQERYPGQIGVQEFSEGDLNGVELTLTDLPLEEFNESAAQAASDLTGGTTVERVGDTYVVEMIFPEDASLDAMGISESQLSLMANAVDFEFRFTFPGPVQEASAGEIDGHTVTLGLTDLFTKGNIRLVGSANDSINWKPLLTWGGVSLAFLLVIGGAAALIIQDRRKSRLSTLPAPTVSDGSTTGPGILPDPFTSANDSNDDPKA